MKGVLLTAGEGTRMWPTTKLYNKAMVQVYNRPMIDYPLGTLRDMGCSEVVIVSSREGLGLIAKHVGTGEKHYMDVTYRVQQEGMTIAEPIGKLAIGGVFPLMLGDCFYSTPPKPRNHEGTPHPSIRPTLFWKDYEFADQHSVWSPEADIIVEKPRGFDLGRRAVISYFYDENIYDFVGKFQRENGRPLEIVDIHNFYRENGADMVEYFGFFADMGTPDGLMRAAQYVQEYRHR